MAALGESSEPPQPPTSTKIFKWATYESAAMDFCYMTLKANTHVEKASKGGFNNEDKEFWGQMARGSFNNNVWVNQLTKSFKIDKSVNRREPTVAFSPPQFERRKTNPKNIASIILGGGVDTQLFPFTRKAATPDVPLGECCRLLDIPMNNYINSGINKFFVFTRIN
uniref:Nucleotidyl transferase domain-containing protein n=1 Tax=Salix viminalis TaxID=40686 RepID=A0A6N2NBT1_SALVM